MQLLMLVNAVVQRKATIISSPFLRFSFPFITGTKYHGLVKTRGLPVKYES